MPVIELSMDVGAPIERVFDLARSIDLHTASMAGTGEQAVGGVTSGLIELDQEVTWRARHFLIWQHLTSRITAFERPHHFRDSQVRGAFAWFDHDHYFEAAGASGSETVVRDRFSFASPLGPLGTLVDWMVLTRYMRAFLLERNRVLRETAEGTGWMEYLR